MTENELDWDSRRLLGNSKRARHQRNGFKLQHGTARVSKRMPDAETEARR